MPVVEPGRRAYAPHDPRRQRRRNPAPEPVPVQCVEPPKKRGSAIWSGIKWLLGGAVIGIAGYEGVRAWRKVRGEEGPVANPSALPGPAAPSIPGLPQIIPFPTPMPMPWPAGAWGHPAPAPAPVAPAPVAPVANPPAATEPHQLTDEDLDRLLDRLEQRT